MTVWTAGEAHYAPALKTSLGKALWTRFLSRLTIGKNCKADKGQCNADKKWPGDRFGEEDHARDRRHRNLRRVDQVDRDDGKCLECG